MTFFDDRVAKLEARCSPQAEAFLHDLRGHPEFAQLVSKLETIGGPIFRDDVEHALLVLRELLKH